MNESAGRSARLGLETTDVLVSGGSLGGLATALALHRRGYEVTVVEAAHRPPEDRWGLTLWPPGLRVLDDLGVGDEVRRRGTVLERLRWLRGDGSEWLGFESEDLAAGRFFAGALPSTVVGLLAEAVERQGIPVLRGWQVRTCERSRGGVEIGIFSAEGEERRFGARLVVAADGADSAVRRLCGLRCFRFPIPGQRVFTAIGGGLPFRELRQAVGAGWSISAVPMGEGASWFAVVVPPRVDGMDVLRRYCREGDPELAGAVEVLDHGFSVAPVTGFSPRWAVDGAVLMGEAAHPIVPHLGLGGSQTLKDVPALVDVVDDALRRGEPTGRVLGRLRRLRRREVGYVQRISLLWGLSSPGQGFLLRGLRDLNLDVLRRHPHRMSRFLRELAELGVPPLLSRIAVWLP